MSAPHPALVEKIRTSLRNAHDAMRDEADHQGFPHHGQSRRDGRYEYPTAALEFALATAFRDLRMFAELLGQRECLADIKEYNNSHHKEFGSVQFDFETDNVLATGLDEARGFFESLLAVMNQSSAEAVETPFKNILQATPTILLEAGVSAPRTEKDVRDPVFKVLQHAYPDLSRANQISHPGKNYVPDFTSKIAQSAAEIKFVKDKGALGPTYDQISADMAGYSGDPDIRFKFALIFLSGAFSTEALAKAHFKSVGKPEDWEIIVRHG